MEKNGIGESADAIWKQLNAEHRRLFPTQPESESSAEVPAGIDAGHPVPSDSLIEAASIHNLSWCLDKDPKNHEAHAAGHALQHRNRGCCLAGYNR